MPKLGIKAELTRRIEAIIEIARFLVKKGRDPKLIQEALIDPLMEAVSTRLTYGRVPEEKTDVDKKT